MGVKKINGLEDFVNKFVRARGWDSTGLDAVSAPTPPPPPPGASTNPDGHTATGGVISDWVDPSPGNVYRTHIFTSTGVFDVSALSGTYPANVEYLVVGGGGGGGYTAAVYTGGGGGGGGGLRTNLTGHPLTGGSYSISATSYTVVVGGGGGGGGDNVSKGGNGTDSEFHPAPVSYPNAAFIRGAGGGGGGNAAPPHTTPYPGNVNAGAQGNAGGGSGGGSSHYVTPKDGADVGAADPNHPEVSGYGGGDGPTGGGSSGCISGGGGGAGSAGGDGMSPDPTYSPIPASPAVSGRGGDGAQVLIAHNPTNPTQPIGAPGPDSNGGYFAGGGGGAAYMGPGSSPAYTPATMTAPLSGGGGSGHVGPGAGSGDNGAYSTGAGGGGGGTGNPFPAAFGGNGGSGIVAVRYQIGTTAPTAKATGGAISLYNGKWIHTFVNSGTFATSSNWNNSDSVEYLIIAGGGSGAGKNGGAGGGAGGVVPGTTTLSHPTSYAVTIGAGGGSVFPHVANGVQGTPSVFGPGPITATGGGYGGKGTTGGSGGPGGSGGGGGEGNSGGVGTNFPGPTQQGNPGGSGHPAGPNFGGGGGGGFGAAGADGTPTIGGAGGIGAQLPTTFRNPDSATSLGTPGPSGTYWVAGGGGGGTENSQPTAAAGGAGGGGAAPGTGSGVNGTANTGGGGGGSSVYNGPATVVSGSGGSGIVLIAYPD